MMSATEFWNTMMKERQDGGVPTVSDVLWRVANVVTWGSYEQAKEYADRVLILRNELLATRKRQNDQRDDFLARLRADFGVK